MSPNEERRPGGNRTPNGYYTKTKPIVQDAHGITRCCYCRRPITDATSVANGFGRVCGARQSAAQLRARRELLLGADALAVVASGLDDVLDALNAEGAIA